MNEPSSIPIDELKVGEPAWRMALLFPPQGSWTEDEYLALDAGRQIEFDQGIVEILDMPTKEHQRLVRFLFLLLQAFVESSQSGEVFFAPLPVRLWNEKYREPDLVYLKKERDETKGYPNGADLVVEVVSNSPADRRRDLETKVAEYEKAGISEYWIVDPKTSTVSVHCLEGDAYSVRMFECGDSAKSKILNGFSADVTALFAAAKE
jgi:Uma2 family endonuclease